MATQNDTCCDEDVVDEALINLLQIEVYVCVAAFLVLFLVVLGSIRRRCGNPVLKFSIWTAYVLSAFLITYTLGMMQSFPFSNEMVAVWAVFLVIFFGSADSISVYSIEDNETRKRYNWDLLVMFFWIAWLILWHGLGTFELPLLILLVLTAMKTDERARAMMLASKSQGLMRNPKLVADFMRYEHTLSDQGDVDPGGMKGYHYLVLREKDKHKDKKDKLQHDKKQLDIKDPKVVTVHKIWDCKGRLVSSDGDPNGRLKDICLSFALFKLLCRRFAGHPWYECSQVKTWNFVRYGLLSKEGDDHERAFRVIERELGFLYDLLYTKYAVIFRHKLPTYRIIGVLIVGVGFFLGLHIIRHHETPTADFTLLTTHGHNLDYRVTGIVIFAILLMEVLQLVFIVFSDWTKVICVSKYVQRPSWQNNRCIEMILRLVCRVHFLKPWERKLGQYSLLHSFGYNPCKLFYNNITASYIDIRRKGQKEDARIKLPVEVKKAVILSIKTNEGRLSNGIASLKRNMVDTLFSWAFKPPKSHVEVILMWHIATSLCENELRSQALSSTGNDSQQKARENITVATSLSKYCAYLVAFHPKFLPEHAYNTEILFDQAVGEARHILKKRKSFRSRCEELMNLDDGDLDQSIVKCGAKLGKSLIRDIKNPEQRWMILADFWAEMMLFVSPSDNASIHAERLAMGGEFVTHLWALLAHAGILKQDADFAGV